MWCGSGLLWDICLCKTFSLLRSAVGKTHVLRSDLWWTIPFHILHWSFWYTLRGVPSHRLYSEIDHIHLSSEAQCVSHHLPQVDCHITHQGITISQPHMGTCAWSDHPLTTPENSGLPTNRRPSKNYSSLKTQFFPMVICVAGICALPRPVNKKPIWAL